jgi:hypothetical protein
VANVTADLDTRCSELYASRDEVLAAGQADSEAAGGGGGRPGGSAGGAGFSVSREQFESLIGFLPCTTRCITISGATPSTPI